jgi:SAM-dependent methyltransferase
MSSRDWDERYEAKQLVWSAEPNQFLPPAVEGLDPGRALDLAAGEGRNAIWLALQGWSVAAVDFSPVGLKKGQEIAEHNGVSVDWVVADVTSYSPEEQFDFVAVFYVHLPPDSFMKMMNIAREALAPGGKIFGVGHALRNLAEGVGGPQHPSILWDSDLVAPVLLGLEDVVVEEIDRTTPNGVAIDLKFEAFAPSI